MNRVPISEQAPGTTRWVLFHVKRGSIPVPRERPRPQRIMGGVIAVDGHCAAGQP